MNYHFLKNIQKSVISTLNDILEALTRKKQESDESLKKLLDHKSNYNVSINHDGKYELVFNSEEENRVFEDSEAMTSYFQEQEEEVKNKIKPIKEELKKIEKDIEKIEYIKEHPEKIDIRIMPSLQGEGEDSLNVKVDYKLRGYKTIFKKYASDIEENIKQNIIGGDEETSYPDFYDEEEEKESTSLEEKNEPHTDESEDLDFEGLVEDIEEYNGEESQEEKGERGETSVEEDDDFEEEFLLDENTVSKDNEKETLLNESKDLLSAYRTELESEEKGGENNNEEEGKEDSNESEEEDDEDLSDFDSLFDLDNDEENEENGESEEKRKDETLDEDFDFDFEGDFEETNVSQEEEKKEISVEDDEETEESETNDDDFDDIFGDLEIEENSEEEVVEEGEAYEKNDIKTTEDGEVDFDALLEEETNEEKEAEGKEGMDTFPDGLDDLYQRVDNDEEESGQTNEEFGDEKENIEFGTFLEQGEGGKNKEKDTSIDIGMTPTQGVAQVAVEELTGQEVEAKGQSVEHIATLPKSTSNINLTLQQNEHGDSGSNVVKEKERIIEREVGNISQGASEKIDGLDEALNDISLDDEDEETLSAEEQKKIVEDIEEMEREEEDAVEEPVEEEKEKTQEEIEELEEIYRRQIDEVAMNEYKEKIVKKFKDKDINIFVNGPFPLKKETIFDRYSKREKGFFLGILVLLGVITVLTIFYLSNILGNQHSIDSTISQTESTLKSKELELEKLKKKLEEVEKVNKDLKKKQEPIPGSSVGDRPEDQINLGAIQTILLNGVEDTGGILKSNYNNYLFLTFKALTPQVNDELTLKFNDGKGDFKYKVKQKLSSGLPLPDLVKTAEAQNQGAFIIIRKGNDNYIARPV